MCYFVRPRSLFHIAAQGVRRASDWPHAGVTIYFHLLI
jgi:hypothetical protein